LGFPFLSQKVYQTKVRPWGGSPIKDKDLPLRNSLGGREFAGGREFGSQREGALRKIGVGRSQGRDFGQSFLGL